jgi:alpha-tubulin suppressor-like RCC1 family protein
MGPTGPVTTHTGRATQMTGLSQVTDVACSSVWHCLALKTDGSVVAWGRNDEGQLGNGGTTSVGASTPVAVIGLTSKVVAIGTTAQASVVVTEDGKVWSWGGAVYHGHAVTTNLLTPTELTTLRSAVRLSCSDRHCTVLRSDGSLWSWGDNGTGELGDGTRIERSTPVQATGLVL